MKDTSRGTESVESVSVDILHDVNMVRSILALSSFLLLVSSDPTVYLREDFAGIFYNILSASFVPLQDSNSSLYMTLTLPIRMLIRLVLHPKPPNVCSIL